MTPRLGSRIGLLFLAAMLGPRPRRALADESPLTLADLAAYRRALSDRSDGPAPLVGFRDLWDRPGPYAGRVVRVEGRVARLFQQGPMGEFPPLVEAWVVSPAQDPFCLVFPRPEGRPSPEVGAPVRFVGTFLKRIRYHAVDTDRLAPLVVGPRAPSAAPSSDPEAGGRAWSRADWLMVAGASLVFALVLARRHLARPPARPEDNDPPPAFLDGGRAGDEEDGHDDVAR